MTDELIPTPSPAASATGVEPVAARDEPADRGDHHRGDQHRPGEAVDRPNVGTDRDPVGEDDVGGEQPRVGERERDAERLAGAAAPSVSA